MSSSSDGNNRYLDDEFAPEEVAMLRSFFRDEAQESLDGLTGRLLDTGEQPPSAELFTEMMRITHTLKGSAGTVGLTQMLQFAHQLEENFALLRQGSATWAHAVRERLVEVVDALRGYVDAMGNDDAQAAMSEHIAAQLQDLAIWLVAGQPGQTHTRDEADTDVWTPVMVDHIDAVPSAPSGPLERAPRGTPKGATRRARRRTRPPTEPPIPEYDGHDIDDTTRSIVADTGGDDVRPEDRGVLRVDPKRIDQLMDSVGELIVDRTRIERRVTAVRGIVRDLGSSHHALTLATQSLDELVAREPSLSSIAKAVAAVSAEVNHNLIELQRATAGLVDDVDALKRTSAGMQTGLTRVRMSSARSLYQTLARQLRTIARGASKQIRLTTTGEDTEFDKTVAERITDPLIQLLRNAVAHGIESADERIAAGKSPVGEIRIGAHQEGSLVVLQLSDDGAGIDPAVLRERFVQAGRWSRTRADLASDEDILHAIFDAGVSTREEADQLAGHGVGLDAVRETIARLGGEIRMTSTPGKGTSFTMRLPVSTAVNHAMLFKLYRDVYAIPYVHVIETATVECWEGEAPDHIEVREGTIPLIHLQSLLGAEAPVAMPTLPAIVIGYAGRQFAITCDKVIGPREIVVKDLGPFLSPLPLYGGATLSGSGKVQLILDTAVLTHLAYPELQANAEPSDEELATTFGAEDSVSMIFHRALVADDSRSIREATTTILVEAGYLVDTAEDGEQAWKLLTESRYDLVVTDIEMPNLDGFGLIERMRGDIRMAEKSVVVMTARTIDGDRERAQALAVRSFVRKPVTRRKLFDALKSL